MADDRVSTSLNHNEMRIITTTTAIVLCLMAITLEAIAIALCDVAEALGQLGKIASDKARRINNMNNQTERNRPKWH
jgi:hypothetical protein